MLTLVLYWISLEYGVSPAGLFYLFLAIGDMCLIEAIAKRVGGE